jgi:hypothetical protein
MDMSGNILEWCLTQWGSNNNSLTGNDRRILRGGSWHRSHLKELEVTFRISNFPDFRVDNRGFRVVLNESIPELTDISFREENIQEVASQNQPPNSANLTGGQKGQSSDEVKARLLSQEERTELLHLLITYFSLEELRTLCFEMMVDYDSLGGEGKLSKARELLMHLERHDSLSQFMQKARSLRPNVPWLTRF